MAEGTSNVTRQKKAKAPAKTPEQRKQERRDRFTRLAPRRVNAALRVIGYVANMGNKAGYEYTEQEANKIVRALIEAVDAVNASFSTDKTVDKAFTL